MSEQPRTTCDSPYLYRKDQPDAPGAALLLPVVAILVLDVVHAGQRLRAVRQVDIVYLGGHRERRLWLGNGG